MLRYKTKTRPGLVALYDIRPGNGAGLFLQPRSPHGAAYLKARDYCYARDFTIRYSRIRRIVYRGGHSVADLLVTSAKEVMFSLSQQLSAHL